MTSSSESTAVASRFSRRAESYEQEAFMQREWAAKLARLLPTDFDRGEILEIGAGTGFFTEQLIEKYPTRKILATDAAPAMVSLLKSKNLPMVDCQVADLRDITGQYPLVAAAACLHWIVPFAVAVRQLRLCLRANGLAVISVPIVGTLAELATVVEEVFPQRSGNRVLHTAEQIIADLVAVGFAIEAEVVEEEQRFFSSAGEMLRILSVTGVSTIKEGSRRAESATIEEITRRYQERYSLTDQTVLASYKILYTRVRLP